MRGLTLLLITSFFAAHLSKGVVCSEDELIRELREDITDNGTSLKLGQLDCFFESVNISGVEETEDMRVARLKANWDSDCAFQAIKKDGQSNWAESLKAAFGIDHLVDTNGKPYPNGIFNQPEQADMCELIRTLVHYNKFEQRSYDPIKVTNMEFEFLDQIDCVGDDGATRVCAVTGGSFFDEQKWIILLQPAFITFSESSKPNFQEIKE